MGIQSYNRLNGGYGHLVVQHQGKGYSSILADVADLFNIRRIKANDIILKPKLLGIEQKVRPWVSEETNPKKGTAKTK